MFVANSEHTLAYYRRALPCSTRRDVVLIPYGFDYGRFRRATNPVLAAGAPLRLINVASFVAKKNQMFLVSVAGALREAGADFHLTLVGDGPDRSAVQAAVDAHGLGAYVSLPGIVDRVEERLWESHMYVHAATYEPFGLVFLEAMAAGLPCVALDGMGNRDIVEEGRNGYLVDDQDPHLFAERVLALAGVPQTYAEVSCYARDFAGAYEIGQSADQFVRLYRSISSRPAGRPGATRPTPSQARAGCP